MYYQMSCDFTSMTAYIEAEHESHEDFVGGKFIDPSKEKLPYRYSFNDPTGSPLYDYDPANNLMSKRLVATLEACGVDNLQKFDVELVDANTGEVHNDYFVVNILGLVSCADVAASETSPLGAGYYFHDLVIDPQKAHGLLMFRLAESLIDVIVHEKVAAAVEAGGFRGIVLTPLKAVE